MGLKKYLRSDFSSPYDSCSVRERSVHPWLCGGEEHIETKVYQMNLRGDIQSKPRRWLATGS